MTGHSNASNETPKSNVLIGSYLTPGLITETGNGLFNKLNKVILSETGLSAKLRLSSIKRARQGLEKGKLDAYFPELWENLPGDKANYVVSDPIFYKRVLLFTLKSSGITQLSELENKLLGVVEGFSYGQEIRNNPALNFIQQDNDITNIKLLLNGRIDGVLGGFPGTVLAVNQHNGHRQVHYDLASPVAVLESFYVCHNSAQGRALCGAINKAIRSLKNKGILELNPNNGFSRLNLKF